MLPINTLLLFVIPILSIVIVLFLYSMEHQEQKRNVLFFVNFLSLFTNPEMQQFDKEYVCYMTLILG